MLLQDLVRKEYQILLKQIQNTNSDSDLFYIEVNLFHLEDFARKNNIDILQ